MVNDESSLQEKLQLILDSGLTILKGALPLEKLKVRQNEINGDLLIPPIFNDFYDEIYLYFDHKERKNKSPVGDLGFIVPNPCHILLNLSYSSLKEMEKRRRGEFNGTYFIFQKTEKPNDIYESISNHGTLFSYDSEKRIYVGGGK